MQGFYPPTMNKMSAEERKKHKEKLLRQQMKYVYNNSRYYRSRFKENDVRPQDIETIEDLRNKLPILMDKDDERKSMEESLEEEGHPFGMHLVCDPEDIRITGGTAGTTGHSTYPYTMTQRDMDFWVQNFGQQHQDTIGMGPGDRLLFTFPLGAYATSVGILYPVRSAGAVPIPLDVRLGTGPILNLIKWTNPDCWYTGPSIASYYIDVFEKEGIDPRELGFKYMILTGEILLPETKEKLEDAYDTRVIDMLFASTVGPGLSCDSDENYGFHKAVADWDLCVEDIVDPETKEPLEIEDGVQGEIVATHLRKRAAPYVRYATGDIAEVYTSECPGCGFEGYRFKIVGRTDDMVTVKGVSVFGEAIKRRLMKLTPEITGRMRIVKESPSPKIDRLKLKVEYGEGMDDKLDQLEERIIEEMQEVAGTKGVKPEIEWVEPEDLKTPYKEPLFEKRYE